jgi:dTDP-4-dehydrorhamnose reductase
MIMKNNKFLITGSGGQLAKEFQRVLAERGVDYTALPKQELDITQFSKTEEMITRVKPAVLLNCAAYNFVDEAEEKPQDAFKVNRDAVRNLAVLCKQHNIFLVHFSTDYVFDGKKGDVYTEEDAPHPLNKYGASKLQGEQAVQQEMQEFLIFRLSWVFGLGQKNFLYTILNVQNKRNVLEVVSDEFSIPTFTEDIVDVVLLALEKGLKGVYHLTNSGQCSRYELAKYYLEKKIINGEIHPIPSSSFPSQANRPIFSCMSNKKICNELDIAIPTWKDAVDRFLEKYSFVFDESQMKQKI